MVDLIAKSPCDGLLPKEIGTVTLSESLFEAITSVAPFGGQDKAVSDALKAQMGAAMPGPNRTTGKAKSRAVWSGRDQVLVLGPSLEPIPGAAMTDQTDAWACVELDGAAARDVLARLVPIDLRDGIFKRGHAARTQLMHMNIVLMRIGADRYGIMAFRSMAGTLVHDLESAMEAVAARG